MTSSELMGRVHKEAIIQYANNVIDSRSNLSKSAPTLLGMHFIFFSIIITKGGRNGECVKAV